MSEIENSTRTVHVSIAGTAREVTVRPCPMEELATCDQFTGPTGATTSPDGAATLYEVWTRSADHEHGFLEVRNLSITPDDAPGQLAEPGAVEPPAVDHVTGSSAIPLTRSWTESSPLLMEQVFAYWRRVLVKVARVGEGPARPATSAAWPVGLTEIGRIWLASLLSCGSWAALGAVAVATQVFAEPGLPSGDRPG